MKKILLALFLLFSLIGNSQNTKALDEQYGFRGIKFETSITEFQNLEQIQIPASMAAYAIPVDKQVFKYYVPTNKQDTAGLDQIIYAFYKDKLYGMWIITSGEKDSDNMLNTLKTAFGSGSKYPFVNIENYNIWKGKKVLMTHVKSPAMLKMNLAEMSITIIISKPLEKQFKQDEQSTNKQIK